MALEGYGRKRKFPKTPEPRPSPGASSGAGLLFVVQKHYASRLHYDLRLEHEGVLKSWAVPKGPPLDPRDKRLAVQVEDHPYAYKDFEGRIPEGNYGAGLVEKWDEGTYSLAGALSRREAERRVTEALRKGHLDFALHGRRLRGNYALVRLKAKKNQWLLLKRSDLGPARAVLAGDLDFEGAVKSPLPEGVRPMLATLVDEPFDKEDWSFEVKWDGYRALAEVKRREVRLFSRSGRPLNAKFPDVAAALTAVPTNALFDGEIVALDDRGRPDFQELQNYRSSGRGEIKYYVFDILYAGGYDLRTLPLRRRRTILEALLPVSGTVRLSESIEKDGRAFYRAAEKNGLEGIMAKDLDSPYLSGRRTEYWLKIKTQKRQEAVICGFTGPRASRKHFGALVLGAFKDGELVYIGHVGTGFDERSLESIHEKLKPLVTSQSPFVREPKTNTPVTWVMPKLICEVKFSEWTADGSLRHPVFLGLREDKSPEEVGREQARAAGAVLKRLDLKTRAELTHLDKVFWPNEGFTKRDVITYYWRMADWILPYLKDRPQALNRHPNGIEEKGFFQKNILQTPPAWVKTIRIPSESQGKELNLLLCQNRDTLLYEANLGCIEINVWNSAIGHLDSPDYVVLDFDPLETPFFNAVEAVLAAKNLLDELDVPAFCKTSGGKGMHIYIPLAPRFSHEQAREFAQLVSLFVSRRHPDLTSLERSPDKRKGKVYLDYLQNRYGATMAAPYALRPREGAPVSTPLEWKEVTTELDPLNFNILTVPERLSGRGDVWKDLFKKRLDINSALARFEKWRKKRKPA
jgi:bifunctional non-homologous end joining protein LigD